MNHEYEVGDKVSIYMADMTKWNRFLYWLIKRPVPSKRQTFKVTELYDSSAVIISHLTEDN